MDPKQATKQDNKQESKLLKIDPVYVGSDLKQTKLKNLKEQRRIKKYLK